MSKRLLQTPYPRRGTVSELFNIVGLIVIVAILAGLTGLFVAIVATAAFAALGQITSRRTPRSTSSSTRSYAIRFCRFTTRILLFLVFTFTILALPIRYSFLLVTIAIVVLWRCRAGTSCRQTRSPQQTCTSSQPSPPSLICRLIARSYFPLWTGVASWAVFDRRWRLLAFSSLVAVLIRQYIKSCDFQPPQPPSEATEAVENIDQNSSKLNPSDATSHEGKVANELPDPDMTLVEVENLVSTSLCVGIPPDLRSLFSVENLWDPHHTQDPLTIGKTPKQGHPQRDL